MGIPTAEAKLLYSNVALIVTMAGTLIPVGIRPIKGRYFESDFGTFLLDSKKSYSMDKLRVFFYHVQIPVSLDIDAIFRIQSFVKKYGVDRFSEEILFKLVGDQVTSAIAITKNLFTNTMKKEEGEESNLPDNVKEAINVSSMLLDSMQQKRVEQALTTRFGETTYAFLRSLGEIDLSALDHAATIAYQSEKELRKSKEIPAFIPRIDESHIALFVIDNKRIERRELKPVKDPETGKTWGYVKPKRGGRSGGRVDLTDKRTRLSNGKSSIYVVPYNTMPELPVDNGNGKHKTDVGDVSAPDSDRPKRGRRPKPRMIAPTEIEALNLHCYDILRDFIRYDALAIQNEIGKIYHTQRHLEKEYHPIKKQPLNPLLILAMIIGFVAIYQGIINPALSEAQTRQEIESNEQRQQQQQNTQPPPTNNNSTNTNPPPQPQDNNGLPWQIPFIG